MKGNRERLEIAGAQLERALQSRSPTTITYTRFECPRCGEPKSLSPATICKSCKSIMGSVRAPASASAPIPKLCVEKIGSLWWIVDDKGKKVRGPYGDEQVAQRDLGNNRG